MKNKTDKILRALRALHEECPFLRPTDEWAIRKNCARHEREMAEIRVRVMKRKER